MIGKGEIFIYCFFLYKCLNKLNKQTFCVFTTE